MNIVKLLLSLTENFQKRLEQIANRAPQTAFDKKKSLPEDHHRDTINNNQKKIRNGCFGCAGTIIVLPILLIAIALVVSKLGKPTAFGHPSSGYYVLADFKKGGHIFISEARADINGNRIPGSSFWIDNITESANQIEMSGHDTYGSHNFNSTYDKRKETLSFSYSFKDIYSINFTDLKKAKK